jgi:sulfate-transporting ATPase
MWHFPFFQFFYLLSVGIYNDICYAQIKQKMSNETIIFSMSGVNKIIPPNRHIIKNIYLSFFYGAKIGVLGLNGSGKSTLLRVIAGIDKDIQGDVVFSPGYSVGMLEQEPKLDPTKTVREVVE